jgi:hypothetical protein
MDTSRLHRRTHLKSSRVGDRDLGFSTSRRRSEFLDGRDDRKTLDDFTEHDVFAVEPSSGDGGDKELRPVGVLARIGHRELPRLGVLQRKVLVVKLGAVDRFTARAIVIGKVTALEHELGNDTVEPGSFVTITVLARGELTEIFGRLWHDVVEQLERDAASGFVVDADVEEDVRHRL